MKLYRNELPVNVYGVGHFVRYVSEGPRQRNVILCCSSLTEFKAGAGESHIKVRQVKRI